MKPMKYLGTSLAAIVLALFSLQAIAIEANSTVAVGGYDLVSYHSGKKPLPGNGNHVVQHDGANYLFASKANADEFKQNPERFLPAYGGYCAFGVSVGKKFIADPTVWEVVEGRLYLNLDNGIKKIWAEDIAGNIVNADKAWPEIRDVAASEL